ncbi:MAG TPA: MBL fold metallo-hydrolase [Nitrospirales bacterium]|nr:MBL fold metallo-hydrolase [Nitrospirales bacterium]
MQVEFLGHAGFIITSGKTRVACDPWLSPRGAFHASWFQFPCNHHLWERDYRDLTAVVITHEHQDHLDAAFLSQKIAPDIPVIIPQHPSRSLWSTIRSSCANPITEVKPGTDHQIGEGLRVLFIADATPLAPCAAATFQTREAVLINMSNARLSAKHRDTLKYRFRGRNDALLIQCAGADWNPICYRHPEEKMQALSVQKRVEQLEYAFQTLDRVPPRIGLPYAGPPAFLEDSLFRYNDDLNGKSIVPDQKRAHDWLCVRGYTRRLEIPLPGDRLNLINGEFMPDQAIRREFSFDRKDAYLKAYADRMRPTIAACLESLPRPAEDLFEPFRAYVQRAGETNESMLEELKMELQFVVEGTRGGDFLARCDAGALTLERTGEQTAACRVTIDSVWLNQILRHNLLWKDFFLSLRFSVEQDPSAEDDHLLSWLKLVEPQALSDDAMETTKKKPAHA